MHTQGFWFGFPDQLYEELHMPQQEFGDALKAVANVLANVAPLYLMTDPRDLSVLPMMRATHSQLPTVFIWEVYPGGVGYCKKLYQIHQEIAKAGYDLVQACPCTNGCPSCVGPALEVGEAGKAGALLLLSFMAHLS